MNKLKVSVIVTLILFLIVPTSVLAQSVQPFELQWSDVYANCSVGSIVQIQDGGFVVVGTNYTAPFAELFLMKINSDGGVEWIKTYPEITGGISKLQVVDSGYVLSTSVGWLKTDLQGNVQWSKQFNLHPRTYIPWVFLEEDGSYVMVRSGYSVGRNYYSFCKYGVDDVLLWDKYIGEANIGAFLRSDSGGGYYIAGSRDQKSWFAKLDLEGEFVWSRTYRHKTSGEVSLVFDSVVESLDGGFLLSGYNDVDSWVVKTDRNGREQWHRKYDRYVILGDDVLYNYDCHVRSVVPTMGGGCLVFRGMDVVVLGSRGNELWSGSYFEYDGELEDLGTVGVYRVSGVSSEDGGLVLAVAYRTATHPGLFDGPISLWVAGFALDPPIQSDSNNDMLLFGVIIAMAVTVVVVGLGYFWFYLKKNRYQGALASIL